MLASSSDFISWKLLLCLELIVDIPMIILIAKVSWLMWFELNEIFFFLDLIADIFDWWLSLKKWVCSLDCYSMKSSSLPKFNSRSLDDYSHWKIKFWFMWFELNDVSFPGSSYRYSTDNSHWESKLIHLTFTRINPILFLDLIVDVQNIILIE